MVGVGQGNGGREMIEGYDFYSPSFSSSLGRCNSCVSKRRRRSCSATSLWSSWSLVMGRTRQTAAEAEGTRNGARSSELGTTTNQKGNSSLRTYEPEVSKLARFSTVGTHRSSVPAVGLICQPSTFGIRAAKNESGYRIRAIIPVIYPSI